jgi:uncharacterized protein (DUF1330 family)
MTAYAIAHLEQVNMGAAILEYLERIDATLAPYAGRFVVHGGTVDVLEGSFSGDLIVIAFPDTAHARQWYTSPAYQAILPLRTANARGTALLVQGVAPDHKATDVVR